MIGLNPISFIFYRTQLIENNISTQNDVCNLLTKPNNSPCMRGLYGIKNQKNLYLLS